MKKFTEIDLLKAKREATTAYNKTKATKLKGLALVKSPEYIDFCKKAAIYGEMQVILNRGFK